MLNQTKKEPLNLDEDKKYIIADYILDSLKKDVQPTEIRTITYEQLESVKGELKVKGYIEVDPNFNYNRVLTEKGYRFGNSGFSFEFFDKRDGNGDIVDFVLFYIQKKGFFPLTKCTTHEEQRALDYAIVYGYINSDNKLTKLGTQISLSGITHLDYELKTRNSSTVQFINNGNINANFGSQRNVDLSTNKDG